MSRGRDDNRSEVSDRAPDRQVHDRPHTRPDEVAARGLALPHGDEREVVAYRGREYLLNGSETRALATVGAFRVVSLDDLGDEGRGRSSRPGDWRNLTAQGLLTHETLTDRHGTHHVVALTREGKDLLDEHATARPDGRQQVYYAEIVKPRELAHDSRLYAAFEKEAELIEDEGGRLTRIVLDYELKSAYQKFLNREDRPSDATFDSDRETFADAHDLTIVGGHLELPDVRIEYQTEDGRCEHRDVELVTEHYSRGQLGGKSKAGFACYRAAGSGRGTGGRKGGTPFDPRNLERL
jgi:hypothetical protein